MEDVTHTVGYPDVSQHLDALQTLPTKSEMDVYILTMMLGATPLRKKVREIFDIIKCFKRDEWRIVDLLRIKGITKLKKMISAADKEIKKENEEEQKHFEEDLRVIEEQINDETNPRNM